MIRYRETLAMDGGGREAWRSLLDFCCTCRWSVKVANALQSVVSNSHLPLLRTNQRMVFIRVKRVGFSIINVTDLKFLGGLKQRKLTEGEVLLYSWPPVLFAFIEWATVLLVWLNQNQSNRRSTYTVLPLWWVAPAKSKKDDYSHGVL